MPTPAHDYYHVSSPEHLKELGEAPENILSLHAISKEMLQPQFTMEGLKVADEMAGNGSVHTRVLRVLLRSRLPQLEPELGSIITAEINRQAQFVQSTNEEFQLKSFSFTKRLFTVVNARVFFGEQLYRDENFLRLAEDYLDHLFQTAEVLRLLPSWLAPAVAPLLMRSYRASKGLMARISSEVEARLAQTPQRSNEAPTDLIQFFVDSSRSAKWSSTKIVQVLLGLWFASVHQPALSCCHALDDLCRFPDYQEELCKELEHVESQSLPCTASPLLGAFLKESCRLHPSDSISVRREVLESFAFSDGLTVPAGNVLCAPLAAILCDPSRFENPTAFNPDRFLHQGKASDLTDITTDFPLWGLGKHAW